MVSSVSSKVCSVSPPTSNVSASSLPWMGRKHRSYVAAWDRGCLENRRSNPFLRIPNIFKIQHSTPERQMIPCTRRTCVNNVPLGHFNGITEGQVGLWYRLMGKRRKWGIFTENGRNSESPGVSVQQNEADKCSYHHHGKDIQVFKYIPFVYFQDFELDS